VNLLWLIVIIILVHLLHFQVWSAVLKLEVLVLFLPLRYCLLQLEIPMDCHRELVVALEVLM